MKISTKSAIINKYIIITCLLIILLPFLSWGFSTNFFNQGIFYTPVDENDSRLRMLKILFPFHSYAVNGYSIMQMIAPIIPLIAILPFFTSKKMLLYTYTREKHYTSTLLKTIIKHVLIASVALYLAYLVFLFIGVAMLPIVPDPGVPRVLFTEILGENFYANHQIIYFMIEGFLQYFVFTFVYALFAVSVSFLTKKTYLCILTPIVYFGVSVILVAVIESAFNINILFLAPTYTLMSNARPYINGFAVFMPLLIPLAFSFIVILREIIIKSKRNDVLATI